MGASTPAGRVGHLSAHALSGPSEFTLAVSSRRATAASRRRGAGQTPGLHRETHRSSGIIFIPFGNYDEPEILPYENTTIYSIGADVRQAPPETQADGIFDGDRSMRVRSIYGKPVPRQKRCLNSVSDLEFLQNVGHVVLNRFFLQAQLAADFLVAEGMRDKL